VSPEHWRLWHALLLSYNDLASSEYRIHPAPAAPGNFGLLERAVALFQHHFNRWLLPKREEIRRLGYSDCLPYIEFVGSHCEAAADNLTLQRYSRVLKALEEALTNYHEIVDALQPQKEDSQDESAIAK
jgi:hypothetical protein